LFVIDVSSSTEDFDTLKEGLAAAVEASWPEAHSRLGVMLFATSTRIAIPLAKGTRSDIAREIRAMQYYGGTTFTKLALEDALKNVWAAVENDAGRERITYLISDGKPADGQSPCDMVSPYAAKEIQLLSMSVGINLLCPKVPTLIVTNIQFGIQRFGLHLQSLFTAEKENCEAFAVATPFNGKYTRTQEMQNDLPVYTSIKGNKKVLFNGETWTFTDADNGMIMSEDGSTGQQIYVESYRSWVTVATDSTNSRYVNVPIVCQQQPFPTMAPTPSPTSLPSPSPTSVPSPSPTTGPTRSPTTVPTTVPTPSPTSTPTFSPTNDCLSFDLGQYCVQTTAADILLMIDVSSSGQDFNAFKETIASNVEASFPADSRLAVVLFATSSKVAFNFDSSATKEQLAAQIRALEYFGGSTWSDQAMLAAKAAVFDPVLSDAGRDKVAILVTDGVIPSEHSPCSQVDVYASAGIDVYSLTINGPLNCDSATTQQDFANHNALSSQMSTLLTGIYTEPKYHKQNCVIHSVTTPFNGEYHRIGEHNDLPTYRHIDNYIAQWNGESWEFSSTHKTLGKMTEAEKSIPQIYPGDYQDWSYLKMDGVVVTYLDVPLKCKFGGRLVSHTPTEVPSVSPSTSEPTKDPTPSPTTGPTPSPTTGPTPSPTTGPTPSPTRDPTPSPTKIPTPSPTKLPTPSPTGEPTPSPTSVPSPMPTKAPTNDCENFFFGDRCMELTALDIVVLIDASTSALNFLKVRDSLAQAVSDNFDATHGRIAIVVYSTIAKNALTFASGAGKTSAQLASEIRMLEYTREGGSTWTASTLQEIKVSVWDPTINDAERQRLTVLVNDGVSSIDTQEPCQMLQQYVNLGIDVKSYTIGNTLNCDSSLGINDNNSANVDALATLLNSDLDTAFTKKSKNCAIYSVMTPFNGLYSRKSSTMRNSYPVYIHRDDHVASFDGETWTFENPKIGLMSESKLSLSQIYPESGKTWRVRLTSGKTEIFVNVPLNCTDERMLTYVPTAVPTHVPTTSEPTEVPTYVPTMAPTKDCVHLLVGSDCVENVPIDVMFLVDLSSSLQTYNEFFVKLGDGIMATFPPTARLAFVTYASIVNVVYDFSSTLTLQQKADMIKFTSVIGGKTMTAKAFNVSYEDAWKDVLGDAGRQRVVVHITDGESSANQQPCDEIEQYQASDITVVRVMVGSTNVEECTSNMNIRRVQVPEYSQSPMLLQEIYPGKLAEDCATDFFTPFNGHYSRKSEVVAGKPVYKTSDKQWKITWDQSENLWIFQEEGSSKIMMESVTTSKQIYPETLKDWSFSDGNGNFVDYNKVRISCRDNAAPTQTPSLSPTVDPTPSPTKMPTPSPTDMPSTSPSDMPSPSPTERPSYAPSQDCVHFIMGKECRNVTATDLLLLVDVSRGEAKFNEFKRVLKQKIIDFFPDQYSRVAVMQFSTITRLSIPFTQDKESLLEQIDGLRYLAGSSWTDRAVKEAYEQIWANNKVESGRHAVTYIIYDGIPRALQNPCKRIQSYLDENIKVVTIDINNEGDLCPSLDYPKYSTSITNSLDHMAEHFEVVIENCDLFSVNTPFNGGYSRQPGPLLNGYPRYKHSSNMMAFFDGESWMFTGDVGMLAEIGTSGAQSYPESHKNWTLMSTSTGEFIEYVHVPVHCQDTVIPTRMPTDAPTVNPSPSPTDRPTYSPSFSPTVVPTPSPTNEPTALPSVAPSISPTSCEMMVDYLGKKLDICESTQSKQVQTTTCTLADGTVIQNGGSFTKPGESCKSYSCASGVTTVATAVCSTVACNGQLVTAPGHCCPTCIPTTTVDDTACSDLADTITNITSANAACNADLSAVSNDLANMVQQNAQCAKDTQTMSERLSECEDKITAFESSELGQVKTELDTCQSNLVKKNAEAQSLTQGIDAMQGTVSLLQQTNLQQTSTISTLETNLADPAYLYALMIRDHGLSCQVVPQATCQAVDFVLCMWSTSFNQCVVRE